MSFLIPLLSFVKKELKVKVKNTSYNAFKSKVVTTIFNLMNCVEFHVTRVFVSTIKGDSPSHFIHRNNQSVKGLSQKQE
jgi:hypothetical protein